MKKLLILCAGLALLASCQGTPIGDAMVGKEKLAQMDDGYCRSIGARPNTDTYVQCRMLKTAQREEGHRRAFQRAGAGMSAAGQSMQQNAYAHRSVNCTSTASSTWVGGRPSTVNTTCY